MDRRQFLAGAGAMFIRPLEFKVQLRGPINSIPTVYTADHRMDFDGVRSLVETGMKAGCKVFALTAGNSQYDRLTYDEIRQLARVMVEAVAGRGMTIAATGPWWTGQAVDYARYAASLGADAVQVFLPGYGDNDTLYEHFRQIAAAAPKCGIVLHGQVPMPLLARLVNIESVVAYKEEYPPAYSVEVFAKYGKRLNIFAGGQKSRFLMFQPYGMQAYYSTFSTFAPKVTRQFWAAIEKGDLEAARQVVVRFDVPFFERWSHAYWRATLECFGIARRHLRPPDRTFTDAEVAGVREFFKGLGLL